jgi:hypothetical protein
MSAKPPETERFRVQGVEVPTFEDAFTLAGLASNAAGSKPVWLEIWRNGRWQNYCEARAGGAFWDWLALQLEGSPSLN